MTITITIPDSKYQLVQTIIEGLQKLVGKDMRVTAEPLKPEEAGVTKSPRKPSKRERMKDFDEMVISGKWRKPAHLKKAK